MRAPAPDPDVAIRRPRDGRCRRPGPRGRPPSGAPRAVAQGAQEDEARPGVAPAAGLEHRRVCRLAELLERPWRRSGPWSRHRRASRSPTRSRGGRGAGRVPRARRSGSWAGDPSTRRARAPGLRGRGTLRGLGRPSNGPGSSGWRALPTTTPEACRARSWAKGPRRCRESLEAVNPPRSGKGARHTLESRLPLGPPLSRSHAHNIVITDFHMTYELWVRCPRPPSPWSRPHRRRVGGDMTARSIGSARPGHPAAPLVRSIGPGPARRTIGEADG
jgi:hypothetical protein